MLAHGAFTIGGRSIDPQKATGRPSGGRGGIKKVFIGGLETDVSESEIRSYFGKYGEVFT